MNFPFPQNLKEKSKLNNTATISIPEKLIKNNDQNSIECSVTPTLRYSECFFKFSDSPAISYLIASHGSWICPKTWL